MIQPESVNHQATTSMKRVGWLIFIVALILRAGWGVWRATQSPGGVSLEFPDEQQYWQMATSLAKGEGLRDEFGFRATRMPLYPGLLSFFAYGNSGIILAKVFHWIVGAGVAVLALKLGCKLFSPAVGVVAGLIVACDPFLIFFSSLLLTETLFIFALLSLYLVVQHWMADERTDARWPSWLLVGLVSALCVYVRESSLGLVMLIWLMLVCCSKKRGQAIGGAVLALCVVVISLLPWAARNSRVAGEWCWLTHRGGISLYDGVGPRADGSGDLGDVQMMPEVRGLDEAAWNRWFMAASWKAMRQDPARIIRLAGVKFLRLWNPLPNVETYQSVVVRAISAVWTIPIYGLALVGVVWLLKIRMREGRWLVIWLLLPAMYFSVVHCLFVGSVRYRLPAMPLLEVLSAWMLVSMWDRRKVRRYTP